MKYKNIIIYTIIILVIVFVVFFFNKKDVNIGEKILANNISYNGEKITLIEKIEKEEGKTSLIIKTKNGQKKVDEFLQNNEIPVEIIDVFIFKTEKYEYIITTTSSYYNVHNQDVDVNESMKDIYIYNSKNQEMYKAEQKFYLDEYNKYYEFDLSNRELILKKLKELEEEGEL